MRNRVGVNQAEFGGEQVASLALQQLDCKNRTSNDALRTRYNGNYKRVFSYEDGS
jgi:hypothetical protein